MILKVRFYYRTFFVESTSILRRIATPVAGNASPDEIRIMFLLKFSEKSCINTMKIMFLPVGIIIAYEKEVKALALLLRSRKSMLLLNYPTGVAV